MRVAVCDYRAGNIRSVEIALRRLGAELIDDVSGADLAVLPGVGSARAALDGLGILPGRSVRLTEGRVPRMGWARVDGTAYYFAHSYAVETPAATAWSDGLVAEARSGSFLGVQFHPEKSGAAGARYLDRVLAEVRERSLSRA